MRRRDFIAALCGAVTGWPGALSAQQVEGVRRIGVLMAPAEDLEEAAGLPTVLRRCRSSDKGG